MSLFITALCAMFHIPGSKANCKSNKSHALNKIPLFLKQQEGAFVTTAVCVSVMFHIAFSKTNCKSNKSLTQNLSLQAVFLLPMIFDNSILYTEHNKRGTASKFNSFVRTANGVYVRGSFSNRSKPICVLTRVNLS